MPGIIDVFAIKVYQDDHKFAGFDTRSFNEVIAVVGKSTWDVMNARKKIKVVWEVASEKKEIQLNGMIHSLLKQYP